MEPRTREGYHRAWAHIDAFTPPGRSLTLSRIGIDRITAEDCEAFFEWMEATTSPNERHMAVKHLKILLDDAMVRLRYAMPSPAAKLKNPQPAGRSAIWLGAEIEMLAAGALELGYHGIALGIRIAWDTMMSPVDVRTLTPQLVLKDAKATLKALNVELATAEEERTEPLSLPAGNLEGARAALISAAE